MSLLPSFFNSYIRFVYLFLSFQVVHLVFCFLSFQSYVRFVYLFLSFQHVHFIASALSSLFPSIRYFLPFVSTLFHPVRYFFPLVSTLRFCSLYVVSFVLSFKLFSFVSYFLPIVLTLPSSSCTSSFHVKVFMSLLPFLRFNSYMRFVYLFLSFHVVHFVTSFLWLQLFFPVRLALPFLSTRPFHCTHPFVAKLFPSIRYFLPFVSTHFRPVRYFFPCISTLRFCSLYVVSFVLNFKLFSSVRYFIPSF